MQTSIRFGPSSITCSHERVYEDLHEGSLTCLDCCLVLEERSFYRVDRVELGLYKEEKGEEEEKNDKQLFEILKVVEELWHVPTSILQETKAKYLKITKELSQGNKKPAFTKRELLACSLYISLMKNECVRLPEEIACIFELHKIKNLFRIGEQINENCLPNVNDFILRFASIFNLSYSEKRKLLQTYTEITFEASIQPKTQAAILIFYYCEHTNRNVSLKEITDKCFISHNNVRHLLKIYPEIKTQVNNSFKQQLQTTASNKRI